MSERNNPEDVPDSIDEHAKTVYIDPPDAVRDLIESADDISQRVADKMRDTPAEDPVELRESEFREIREWMECRHKLIVEMSVAVAVKDEAAEGDRPNNTMDDRDIIEPDPDYDHSFSDDNSPAKERVIITDEDDDADTISQDIVNNSFDEHER